MKNLIRKLFKDIILSNERSHLAGQKLITSLLEKQWNQSNNSYRIDEVDSEKLWSNIQRRCGIISEAKSCSKHMYVTITGIAASIVILICGIWMFTFTNEPVYVCIKAPATESLEIKLPDNSTVWINKSSEIRYRKDFLDNRDVYLVGEAYFDVESLAGKHFEVHFNNAKIEVKGTKFNIKSVSTVSEIVLFSGSVIFSSDRNGERQLMKPADRIEFDSERGIISKSQIDLIEYDWRALSYKFTDKTLVDLLKFIDKLYNVKTEISNPEYGSIHFSGTIRANDNVEDVLENICISTNLKVKRSEDQFKLYR